MGQVLQRAGGGLGKLQLAAATARPEDVMQGKTFYAGGKELQTGLATVPSLVEDIQAAIAWRDPPRSLVINGRTDYAYAVQFQDAAAGYRGERSLRIVITKSCTMNFYYVSGASDQFVISGAISANSSYVGWGWYLPAGSVIEVTEPSSGGTLFKMAFFN